MARPFRRHIDDSLEECDGEGEWRSGIDILGAILEGDREVILGLCKDQEWGWREALGVWGVWVDVRLSRESLPSVMRFLMMTVTNICAITAPLYH